MVSEEVYNDPVNVVFSMNETGRINVEKIIWQGQTYRATGMGRQWDEPEGRHVLTETAGGTRFELQLRRQDFTWRVKRVWRAQAIA